MLDNLSASGLVTSEELLFAKIVVDFDARLANEELLPAKIVVDFDARLAIEPCRQWLARSQVQR